MLPFTGMPLETMISKMQWRREYRYRYKYKKRERERIYNRNWKLEQKQTKNMNES